MQPTPRTWESLMTAWYSRGRRRSSSAIDRLLRLQRQFEDQARHNDMLRRHSFLPPPNEHLFGDELEQLFRVRSALGQPSQGAEYPALQSWLHERQRPVIPWSVPDTPHVELRPLEPAVRPRAAGAAGSASMRSAWWRSAAAGWAWLALVLLALLTLLLIRKRHARKVRRTRSQEWPTPNVIATNPTSVHNNDFSISPRVDTNYNMISSEADLNTMSNDLPPPYSECASTEPDITHYETSKFVMIPEEPPPPYSSCYVAFSNPKNDIPSVHFYNNQRQSLFDNRDTGIEVEHFAGNENTNEDGAAASGSAGSVDNEVNNREVCINDRIVNDDTVNVNYNTALVTRDGHSVDNVGHDALSSDSIATPHDRNFIV